MKLAGSLLMLLGAVMALFAFFMDTSVYTSGTFVGGTYVGGGSTHNLGLLQQQMMVLQTGLAGFVAGSFLYGSAASGSGNETIAVRPWHEVQEGETEEERDERVERERRKSLISLGVVIVALLALGVLVSWANSSSDITDYEGVDENLTMNIDTNVDENLATDLNSM